MLLILFCEIVLTDIFERNFNFSDDFFFVEVKEKGKYYKPNLSPELSFYNRNSNR